MAVKKTSRAKARNKAKTRKSSARPPKKPVQKGKQKVHSWRLCPIGEHWVTTHPLHVPADKLHPTGFVTTRHGHCASNPSRKDQLYPDEIREISNMHFKGVKEQPCPVNMGFGANGKKYDELIAGWVKYWNDVLNPKESLDPNIVKALIATESSFHPDLLANKKNRNSARGLMQITNDTRKILGNEKGELGDHFLTLTREDLNEPSLNICAGVRWLFHKRRLASRKLGRDASWEEAIQEFKGTRTASAKRAKELMDRYEKRLEELKECGKK